jgi:hypothetical protein
MGSSEDKLWVSVNRDDQQQARSSVPSQRLTYIYRPPNTSSTPLQLHSPTRKLALEAISPQQLKRPKNHQQPRIQHPLLPPVLVARLFIIQTHTLQLIVNKPLAPTLTTAQAMDMVLIGLQLTGNLQDDGEETHLESDFPATCRIDHSMF